jgi:radical SAM protein with 4Fe4S-binding SPASM domain
MYGIKFSAPISYENPMGRPCGLSGKSFFITVDGFVGSCLAVTSKDSEYNELFFGHFDKKNARIIIDEKKLDFLRKRITQNIPACQNCFMKWNCAGGCAIASCLIYGRDIYSPDTRFCKSNRKLGRELLLYKVQKDLIKIKPFLEERSGKMIYNGVFNEFELAEFPNMKSGVGVMLRIDINRSNLATLTNKLIKSNPRLALLSFKITQRNLNLELGQKIEKFLKALKSNRVAFIIARPLPRCIFNQKYDELIKEFKIPKNCGECLELFLVKGDSFHICKTNKKIPQNKIKTRKHIYEFFKEFSKIPSTLPCNTCVYRLRQKCNGCVCE